MTRTSSRDLVKRLLYRDSYSVIGYWIFLVAVFFRWRGYVGVHEAIYLLGPRRVIDPELLASDLTWSVLSPTNFVYDHLLAPLWSFLSDYGIVNLGRFVTWFLVAWALTMLARSMRLPPWSVVLGFTLWILAGQTLILCGKPLEGFQPKSLPYALVFIALAFALRGKMLRAGLAAGVATAIHIIIGGWGCLALCLAMLVDRKSFSFRQIGLYLLACAPFIVPLVLAVGMYNAGHTAPGEQAVMDEVYVTFAWPRCLDPALFMTPERFVKAALVFFAVPVLMYLWPEKRATRTTTYFVMMLILFFVLGILARPLEFYWFLKLFPCQLGKALPLLFMLIFGLAYFSVERPKQRLGKVAWILAILVSIWILDEKNAARHIRRAPEFQVEALTQTERERYGAEGKVPDSRQGLYAWMRESTPRQSIFITPCIAEFWTFAERAQVVSFRHPPLDRRLIEWRKRLDAINGHASFAKRGFEICEEISINQPQLDVTDLIQMRERFGATHYLTTQRREELADHLLYSDEAYFVYGLTDLAPDD